MLKQRHMAVDEIDELADADGREQRPDAHADDIAEKQPRQQCRDEEMRISVTSNTTLTLPKRRPLTLLMAATMPSPGTMMRSGATSTLMPKASTMQPAMALSTRVNSCCGA